MWGALSRGALAWQPLRPDKASPLGLRVTPLAGGDADARVPGTNRLGNRAAGGALAHQSNELRHRRCHFALGSFLGGIRGSPGGSARPSSPLARCPRCPAGLRRFPGRTDRQTSRPGAGTPCCPARERARSCAGPAPLAAPAPPARLGLSGGSGLARPAAPAPSLFSPPCSIFCPASAAALTLLYQQTVLRYNIAALVL